MKYITKLGIATSAIMVGLSFSTPALAIDESSVTEPTEMSTITSDTADSSTAENHDEAEFNLNIRTNFDGFIKNDSFMGNTEVVTDSDDEYAPYYTEYPPNLTLNFKEIDEVPSSDEELLNINMAPHDASLTLDMSTFDYDSGDVTIEKQIALKKNTNYAVSSHWLYSLQKKSGEAGKRTVISTTNDLNLQLTLYPFFSDISRGLDENKQYYNIPTSEGLPFTPSVPELPLQPPSEFSNETENITYGEEGNPIDIDDDFKRAIANMPWEIHYWRLKQPSDYKAINIQRTPDKIWKFQNANHTDEVELNYLYFKFPNIRNFIASESDSAIFDESNGFLLMPLGMYEVHINQADLEKYLRENNIKPFRLLENGPFRYTNDMPQGTIYYQKGNHGHVWYSDGYVDNSFNGGSRMWYTASIAPSFNDINYIEINKDTNTITITTNHTDTFGKYSETYRIDDAESELNSTEKIRELLIRQLGRYMAYSYDYAPSEPYSEEYLNKLRYMTEDERRLENYKYTKKYLAEYPTDVSNAYAFKPTTQNNDYITAYELYTKLLDLKNAYTLDELINYFNTWNPLFEVPNRLIKEGDKAFGFSTTAETMLFTIHVINPPIDLGEFNSNNNETIREKFMKESENYKSNDIKRFRRSLLEYPELFSDFDTLKSNEDVAIISDTTNNDGSHTAMIKIGDKYTVTIHYDAPKESEKDTATSIQPSEPTHTDMEKKLEPSSKHILPKTGDVGIYTEAVALFGAALLALARITKRKN